MQLLKENGKRLLGSIFGVLFFLVCLFLMNTPEEFTYLPVMMRFADRTMYILSGCLVILYAFLKKKPFQDGLFLSSCVFCAYIMITTIAHQGQTLTVFNNYIVRSVGTVLLFSLFFEIDPKKFGLTAYIYYLLIVLLNHATAIGYRGLSWAEPTWIAGLPYDYVRILCGNYNLTFIYAAIAFALGWFVSEQYAKWLHAVNFSMLAYSLYIGILTDCYTEMLVFGLMFILGLYALIFGRRGKRAKLPKVLNEYVFAAVNIAGAVVLYLNSAGKLPLIAGIDEQMHGRTPVWAFAVEKILEKPLFGNGLQVPLSESINYSHVHSLFLEMPYLSGIVGVLAFLGLALIIVLTIRKNRAGSFRFGFSFLFSLFFTASIMEFYPVQGMFTLFAILYYGSRAAMISEEES